MIGKTNAGSIVAFLNVSCPNSSSITIQSGNIFFSATGTNVSFKLPRIGDWTITASYNGITVTKTVTITAGQTLNETMMDNIYLYNAGVYATGFASGWSAGDYGTYISVTGGPGGSGVSQSSGSVNLTGYRIVAIHVSGDIGGSSNTTEQAMAEIITEDGTQLLQINKTYSPPEWGGSQAFDETWGFDVSSINSNVKFRISGNTWAGGSDSRHATINLHSIQLIA